MCVLNRCNKTSCEYHTPSDRCLATSINYIDGRCTCFVLRKADPPAEVLMRQQSCNCHGVDRGYQSNNQGRVLIK